MWVRRKGQFEVSASCVPQVVSGRRYISVAPTPSTEACEASLSAWGPGLWTSVSACLSVSALVSVSCFWSLGCCFLLQLLSPQGYCMSPCLWSLFLCHLYKFIMFKQTEVVSVSMTDCNWYISSTMFFLVSLSLERCLPYSALLFEWNSFTSAIWSCSPDHFLCPVVSCCTEYGAHSWPSWLMQGLIPVPDQMQINEFLSDIFALGEVPMSLCPCWLSTNT